MKAAAINDYRELARRRLPHFLFEYIDGGSYAEVTLARNMADLQSVELRQRVLRDISSLDTSTTLFGQPFALPLGLAPVGLAGLNARRGEVQAARAAAAARVPFCLSTVSACPLEEVVQGSPAPIWFQLYMVRDRVFMADLLARAAALGCPTLVFTVDLPLPGSRYRDVRSGLSGSVGLRAQLRRLGQVLARPRWAWDVGIHGRPHELGNVAPLLGDDRGLQDFFAWMRGNFDPSVNWDDLAWVRAHWKGPIVLKGILDVEDAKRAAELGLDGIVVSNHGGRQLDGVPSTAAALPGIAREVGDQLTVLADGGVRSGLDVFRMLALGAKGVLLGRAWAYALGAEGQAGVAHMLDLLEKELRVAMALTGCTRIAEIGPECLVRR
jgi:L-lactate dehydrogenase (cytochrome)